MPATGLDELKEAVKKFTAKEVASKAGVDEAQLNEAVALLAQAKAPAIIFGSELTGQDKGMQNALALANLFLLVGKPGVPGSALYPVAEKNNTRGVCAVGVLPDRCRAACPWTPTPPPLSGETIRRSPNPAPTWRRCWTWWRRAMPPRLRPSTSWAAICCGPCRTAAGWKNS